MELIRPDTHYDFIGKRKITVWISAVAILLCLGSILVHGGLRYGVDFAGGLLLQIRFANPVDISEVRSALETMGAKEAMVQNFGGANEFLIRVEKASDDIEAKSRSIQASLKERFKDKALEIRRAGIGGPTVGGD